LIFACVCSCFWRKTNISIDIGHYGFVSVVSLVLHYKKIEIDLENKLDELGKED